MSLFSRLFRQAPPFPPPERTPPSAAAAPVPRVSENALATARDEKVLEQAIASGDSETVARLVVAGASTRIRQRAAQEVADPATLRQLIRDVRGGNDKSVYRILTSKRDEQLAQARKLEQLQAEVAAVVAAVERHSQRSYDPLFTLSLEQLEIRWKSVVADADSESREKVRQAIDRSREVIALHLRQVAQEAARQLAAANAAAEQLRLRELDEKTAAAAAAERAAIAAARNKEHAEKAEAEAKALREIGTFIRRAQGALRDGASARAAGLRRRLEDMLPTAPPLPPYLVNQLQQLDATLAELKDWKSFSVVPKRAELLEEMESLIGASLEPVVLADRIRTLQSDWRTLSKGAGENLETDWQRFQEASQKAYQPCHEYFEAQGLVRKDNLVHRETLLERLAAFEANHDWTQPDWRLVLTALRESRQEWRQYFPVERAPGRSTQERFAALSAGLQNRLDAQFAANVKEKESLVERAQQLLVSADSRQAIEAVKELQVKWKAVGPVPRAQDNRLWDEFRQRCDAVFQRRQQEFTEYAASLETNKANGIAACEEVERIAELSGQELLEQTRRLPELRAAFEAIGEFPRASARDLVGRFERACERCDAAISRQDTLDAERSWTDLFDTAEIVRAYRLAKALNAAPAELEILRQAADARVAAVTQWPRGSLAAIRGALAKEVAGDVSANEASLRTLCIRAEILAERPSPAEDQQLRRDYQVQRLIQNMGQGLTADESQLDTMVIEWLGVGPVGATVYAGLLNRFRRCRG